MRNCSLIPIPVLSYHWSRGGKAMKRTLGHRLVSSTELTPSPISLFLETEMPATKLYVQVNSSPELL